MNTPSSFPIPKRSRLPARISPCPILEAILEIRYVTAADWALLPGLLYNHIKERYPESMQLPITQMPEEFLRSEPGMIHAPRIRFQGKGFAIQFGPRVISLMTVGEYPGWSAIKEELVWLLEKLKDAAFIHEGERLGMRYIDFFEHDIFSQLELDIRSGGEPVGSVEMNFATVFRREQMTARLALQNGAMALRGKQMVAGSILDLDVWLGPSDFEIFGNVAERFEDAHRCNKEIFFGLLKTEFLDSLAPVYE